MIRRDPNQYWTHCSRCNKPFPRAKGHVFTKICEECNLGKSDVLLKEHQNKRYREYCEEATKNQATSLEMGKNEVLQEVSNDKNNT